MSMLLLVLATCFLAYSNGANDNFKGVASLFGSQTTGYRTAIGWATVTTAAGSTAAVFLGQLLLKRFSGEGLVPDALAAQPEFLLSVALGAGATVNLATLLSFPISTTHSLTGALVGAGLVSGWGHVKFAALGHNFLSPLLVSPVLALATGAAVYGLVTALERLCGAGRASVSRALVGMEPVNVARAATAPVPMASKAARSDSEVALCDPGIGTKAIPQSSGKLLIALHFLSAGAVSFARGLNDTPKIAALLLVIRALDIHWSVGAVTVAIAAGGLLNARKVAETMAHKITGMNPSQGLAANLATALLVNTASYHGLPVSTTHVSVGALLGIGVMTNQAKWKPVFNVVLSWIVTLPCAAVLAALAYFLLRPS